ncbi:divalent-cation tolerance protein CutA [Vibrio tapetis subsp. quintayensis]|uniref:divalent-cation tolerance protein CutA n=1 Tax=Vibrio tapetis TaxID=52443 RepID=UPI0025B2A28A|nr:divalent-cation tolerance protein CutA [Vibrio tapetis]MDN3680667.1 divalent-cation tolerance protein CutA [Vibrio tapetis subsp. quintayensis]
MNHNAFCTVLTTCNNESIEKQIIKVLLELKLAACIQVMPIESHYLWKGEVCCDNERLLIIKSTAELFEDINYKIQELHNYDVPQIVQLPITAGFNEYLDWIKASTKT